MPSYWGGNKPVKFLVEGGKLLGGEGCPVPASGLWHKPVGE